jgi:hypothetical protein
MKRTFSEALENAESKLFDEFVSMVDEKVMRIMAEFISENTDNSMRDYIALKLREYFIHRTTSSPYANCEDSPPHYFDRE